jgi:hypothetical protein
MPQLILFRPGDSVASMDVDAKSLREALACVSELRPDAVLQLSFRRAWAGNGYTLLLRATAPGGALQEFLLWRFAAESFGVLKDTFDVWHELEASAASDLGTFLAMHKSAKSIRVRVIPKSDSAPAMVCFSPAPDHLAGKLNTDRVWAVERTTVLPEESRDVLPDWSLAGDGIALMDGQNLLAEMRRIRGPGRAAKVPHLARMQAMPAVTFGVFDSRLEHAQRILHLTRVAGGLNDPAAEESEEKLEVYLPAMCSRRVPGSITWFSHYDDTVRALAACQHVFKDQPFRVRMAFDDGSGWLWFTPEPMKGALRLDDDVRRDLPFIAAVSQKRPSLSEQLLRIIEEVDPSALTLEDLFVQQESQLGR